MTTVDVSSGTAYAGRDANHALGFRQFSASKHAQYFTPTWLAELLCEVLQPLVPPRGPGELAVLDPTCGSGRLLAPWKRIGASVLGIELDELAADHARFALGTTNVRTGDILDYRHLLRGFSLVVTNPPYGLWWTPPDAGELWACETAGGKIESQGATLEIATKALCYNGVLVAIIPTTTFDKTRHRALRDTLYTNYKGLLHLTLPNLFEEEYGISVSVDLVVARRVPSSSWQPFTIPIRPESVTDDLRYAFRRAFDAETYSTLPDAEPSPLPVLSRLFNVSPSHTVRVTPKGLKCAPDAEGMLAFLDEVVSAFDPVRGIEHGIVSATLSPASILTLGPRAGVETLAWLGFEPAISDADHATIARLQEKFRLLRTPLYPPEPHQRLAYLDDRSYTAKATVNTAEDAPCFTAGRSYHLRPSWVRHRETAKVETVTQDDKDVTLITKVDRGYLAFEVLTDAGPRTFREIDAADVELLTAAFELPDVADLEVSVPARITQHRATVARRSAFLFPFQAEDVARMAVKPFGYLGYEQGGGKTVTAASWARTRGFKRVLVVCPSGLIENWMSELQQFGFRAQRLTTHAGIAVLQEEKRRRFLPDDTTFYITSFEFLSLRGAGTFDAWTCKRFTKDGGIDHEITGITRAACPECKRSYESVVDSCPSCGEVSEWSGSHCRACTHQAWSATRDARQWPAYKRIKKLFGAVLVDEAQIAKSKNTLRGRAVRAMRPKGRLILTCTLMKGYATDIFWNVAWLLGFDNPLFPYAYRGGSKRFLNEFGTYEFVDRQFEDSLHEGRAKLLPEVSNLNRFWRLMASFAIRRRKDDIYDLPTKHQQIVVLNLDGPHRPFYNAYADWAQKAIAKALREGDGTPNMGVISNALWKLRYAATCPVAIDYLDPTLDVPSWNKLDYVLTYVRRAAERGEKAIVFSGLRVMVGAMVAHLKQHGIGVLPITAEVPTKKRFGLIQEFSRTPELNCIVASLNCLNRGYTITAANHVLLVDLEYSPEATDQAGDRAHRPGQTKPVYVQVLLSRDTIDQIMWEVVTQKAEAIRHAIDGKARFLDVAEILQKATGDVQLEIARRLERISLLPVPQPVIDLEAAATPIENVLPFPVAPVITAVHEPLIALAQLPRMKPVQLALFGSML
ncbi:MAG TPA: helicase-related protein [Thermoanaerobaculia bacterium]|nr:helicase-related protein [Thermoanaerobaculia bacterium]